jgi:hypothetical protein
VPDLFIRRRRWPLLCAAGAVACAMLAATGCGSVRAGTSARPVPRQPAYGPVPVPQPQLTPRLTAPCGAPGEFTCRIWQRIGLVKRYLAGQPGEIGIELHDRDTGATWGNKDADTDFPAASTIKLAMAADLMQRQHAGTLTLSPADWSLMSEMLYDSDDAAADELWPQYFNGSFLQQIRRFGMRSAFFTSSTPYWGFMYCSPHDLVNLMDFILDRLPARDRDFIVYRMRRVGPIERWGVWGAGRANHPGVKDGWENEGSVWVTDTVGFAGPRARYTLAIMDNLGGAGSFHQGSTTLTEAASLLFRGRLGPAPTAVATPNPGSPVPLP